MAAFTIFLLLQMGFVLGSNYGYVEWSEQEGDSEIRGKHPVQSTHVSSKDPHHHPTYFSQPVTERTVLAHKIEEDLPRVVTAFLHTGDSTTLKQASCSRRYELSSLRGGSYIAPHHSLHSVLDTVTHAANFLNMILQANRSREHSLRRDMHWYHALVQSMLEGDPKIHRAVVTFSAESSLSSPHIFLQATKMDSEIVLQDLSSTAHHYLKNKTAESEWFNEFKDRKKPQLHRRAMSQDAKLLDGEPRRGDTYVLNKTHIKWSAPYLECENGNFIPHWLLTLSVGFYGLKPNLAPEFRGVVRVDVNLQDMDINQCSSTGWFAGTHRCNLTTMECKPVQGHGFVLDKYKCHCRHGFYHPSRVAANGFERTEKGQAVSVSPQGEGASEGAGGCLPCREGCSHCKDDKPCLAEEDGPLRLALVSFQGLCAAATFVSTLLVYHFRRSKRIKASGLVLLEVILSGSLLLYFPVMILYFKPSIVCCILLRWVRLLGFATVYGTVILKLYRVLKVFLSRTAQRIPYMTSWRVLRLLTIILLVVCWFLVAWTLGAFQSLDRGSSLIDVGLTPEGLQFSTCLLDRWDYMMAIAEGLFLLWGVYLCYAVRTVPSAFHEPRYMAVAIYNELVLSAVFHIVRFTLALGLHPDWMLMLFFGHSQLTVTVTLGLLLVPKFLFASAHTRDDIATEAYEDELDMGRSGSYLNSSITSAWSEHSLDPEDIREELKKLYAQLEIYKRKKMLANNPHLQKKRSSKKGLGRSLMRRITEIPETMSRQCSRDDKDPMDHGSNRNSLCTLRRNPLDPSHISKSKEDSLKNKVFSLKKSHSSYDHVRDQSEESNSSATDKMEVSTTENSLLDTLMGKKLARKSPDKAETESTESVPLVCKSASAHNLTADKKPMHLRTSMLQKSLSVISSAKEKTLGLTGKTQNADDGSKKGPHKKEGKESKTISETNETTDCYPKMIVSQSVEYRQSGSKTGIMKHAATGSQPSICSEPGRSKELYDLSEVCPWEVEDLPTPSENKVQKHVSIAPTETNTIHGGGTKGKSQQRQKTLDHSLSSGKRSNQKASASSSREEAGESRGQKKGMKPQIPLNLGGSSTQRVEVCPWEFEETQAKAESTRSPDNIRRKKSVTPTEGKSKALHSDHSKSTGSLLQPRGMREDICPWDFDALPSPTSEKTPSPTPVSKGKDSHSKKKGAPSKTLEREKSKDRDEEKHRSKGKERGKSSEKRRSSQSRTESSYSVDAESGRSSAASEKRRSSTKEPVAAKIKAEVCPWDFEGASDNKEQVHSPSTVKQNTPNSKPIVTGNAKMADVCPWDFDDTMSGKSA